VDVALLGEVDECGFNILEVQQFFENIYIHSRDGGVKQLIDIYRRGELEVASLPDGEEEEGEMEVEEMTEGRMNSDEEMETEEEEVEVEEVVEAPAPKRRGRPPKVKGGEAGAGGKKSL
jgi:hypothetical protein